ncbi:hypothetical protein A6A19_01790 [Actinobacillus delphinicola]|uniref:YadA-like family protein n=1 Tax=Actinobacillus delphinicola TaxID=51161 RepID=UPI0024434B7D|nr:YadA-like family protein [Actinobacillus delphinicola]MDG6896759.1 hypothetical protein [Actinobacillus delphinicola]
MNKIFKVIFNKNTHQLVVVSELGKSKHQGTSLANSSTSSSIKHGVAIAILGLSTLALSIQMAFAQDAPMTTSANQIDPNLIVGNDPTSNDDMLRSRTIKNTQVHEVGESPFTEEPLLATDTVKKTWLTPDNLLVIGKVRKSETSFLHQLSHLTGHQDIDAVDIEELKRFFLLGYIKGNANTGGTSNNNQYWRSTIQIIGAQADANSHYSSDNLTTVYSKNGSADSTITIKMKDDPTFKQVTLKNEADPLAKTIIDGRGVIIHTADGGKVSLTAQGLDNGNNPIRNVGDGVQDTDAVNQRQLKAATAGLADKGLKLSANSGDTVTNKLGSEISVQGSGNKADLEYSSENIKTKINQSVDKTTIDIMLAKDLIDLDGVHIKNGPSLTQMGIDAADKRISNVGMGKITADSGDAINGSQFYALGNILGLTPNKILTGFTPPTFQPLIKTNGDIGAEAIDYQTAINDLITKINQGFIVNGNSMFPNTTNQQYLGSTINIIGATPSDGVTYSDRNITTVYQKDLQGNGTITIKMSETPSFEQITLGKANSQSHTIVDGNGLIIHSANGGKVTVTEHGLDNGGNVIANVGKGVAPTDAVNKSQLDEAIKDSIVDVTDKGLLFGGNSGHTVTNKLGSEVIIKGDGHEDDHQYSGENIKTRVNQDASGKTTIDILLAKNLAVESVTAHDHVMIGSNYQNITIKDYGIHIQNGPSLTVGGLNNAGKVISNVADGVNAQDAVTISQLEKVYNVIKDQLDKGLDFSGDTGETANTAIGSSVEILGDQNIQTHVEKTADDKTKVNIHLNDHLNVKNITLKNDSIGGTTIVNQEGVAIKSATGEKNVNLTSQGLDNGGNVISNVADGKAPTDAVNVKQLDILANDVQDLKKNIGVNVGRALSDIHHQIKENRKESHAGIAAAIATANLPQSFSAGSNTVSAAVGIYRNQQAISIGVSRISDNGKWTVKSAITQDTQSNFGAGMGLGYNW